MYNHKFTENRKLNPSLTVVWYTSAIAMILFVGKSSVSVDIVFSSFVLLSQCSSPSDGAWALGLCMSGGGGRLAATTPVCESTLSDRSFLTNGGGGAAFIWHAGAASWEASVDFDFASTSGVSICPFIWLSVNGVHDSIETSEHVCKG